MNDMEELVAMKGKPKTCVLVALLLGLHRTPFAAGGQIAGLVRGDDGSAIAGATVLLRTASAAGGPQRGTIDRSALTTAGGAFQFDLLPTGRYLLCAQTASGGWLNPCGWSGGPIPVNIAATAAPVAATIVIRRGVVVPIRVNDPAQLLPQNEGFTPGAHLLLGVRTPASSFYTVLVTEQDSAGRSHTITVPFGAMVNLVVASSFFDLASGSGSALPSETAIPLNVAPGQTAPAITINVAGRR